MFGKLLYYKIQGLLNKHATGKNVIIFFVITQLIYFFMILYTIPMVMNYASGMKLLDLQLTGYSVDYVKNLFVQLGSEGRNAYLFRQLPIDMIYPSLFAMSNSLLLTYLFKKSFHLKNWIHYLSFIPLLGGFVDYMENISTIVMLSIYPTFSFFLASLANAFTLLKSGFVTLFFVILIVAVFSVVLNQIKKWKIKQEKPKQKISS